LMKVTEELLSGMKLHPSSWEVGLSLQYLNFPQEVL
jgi:hypothetical protein